MNLRQLAELDLSSTLEDAVGGFGQPVTLASPDGLRFALVGSSVDISLAVDPNTGVAVSGRTASVVLRLSSLTRAQCPVPRGVANTRLRPWLVEVQDVNGGDHVFKVSSADPDNTLGVIVLALEVWR